MAAVDVQDAEISTTACISPDGEFIVHSHRGAVWLSPVDPDNVKHARVLTKPDDITYGQLGDVMALAVSEDGSTIAAVYICVVKFWWIHDRMSSQSLDIGFTFREAFGHVAFSPDGRRVVLGTWEGSVIQYVWYDGIFHFHSRSGVGKAILHLSWSKDGHFIAVSSSGGVTFIQPH
jgi:WD40 repeat protein